LGERPDTHVAIISGRGRAALDAWFGGVPVDIAAEHGVWLRDRQGVWVQVAGLDSEWKKLVRPWLEFAAARLAGAYVEEKEYALVWNQGGGDPQLGRQRARQLREALTSLMANANVKVVTGNGTVEVRSSQMHKGAIAGALMARRAADFVLAIGDDVSDEDMFRGLPASAYTVKVGAELTCARYSVTGPDAVLALLNEMAEAPEGIGGLTARERSPGLTRPQAGGVARPQNLEAVI
jgi:trehalose 6-phosphate synthase/phosphatase